MIYFYWFFGGVGGVTGLGGDYCGEDDVVVVVFWGQGRYSSRSWSGSSRTTTSRFTNIPGKWFS